MKHFGILLVVSVSIIFSAVQGFAGELLRGTVVDAAHDLLNVATGEKVAINLGSSSGVIKGDVLTVYPSKDIELQGAIGWCEVSKVFADTSVCQLIKVRTEIELGNTVTLPRLEVSDKRLYPTIFGLMNAVVKPYKASSDIRIRVYDFFDKDNNMTEFSKRLKDEVLNIFAQKEKIIINKSNYEGKDPAFYPDGYMESEKAIKIFMQQHGIDVLITGAYEKQDRSTVLKVLKIDKNWGNEQLMFDLPPDIDEGLTRVLFPYKPAKKRETLSCDVTFNGKDIKLRRDIKDDIIQYESKGSELTNIAMKKMEFNIIGVVNLNLKIGDEIIEFSSNNTKQINLIEGMNRLTATYKRGYYKNETLVHTSSREEKTEILLYVKKGGSLVIDIIASPLPAEKPVFNIYKKIDRERLQVKPVPVKLGEKTIEMYRD
jgi:hypothetical protein